MFSDLTISYISNGIETTLTIKDDHYDNLPYNLADMFAKVIRESDANPQIVIDNLKNAFEYELKENTAMNTPSIGNINVVSVAGQCPNPNRIFATDNTENTN